jgi:hypothetical protein
MIEIWILQCIRCRNKKKSEEEDGLLDNDCFYILLLSATRARPDFVSCREEKHSLSGRIRFARLPDFTCKIPVSY